MTQEIQKIRSGLKYMSDMQSDAYPLGEGFRSRQYRFSAEAKKIVRQNGCSLEFFETFCHGLKPDGCWSIVRK